MADDPNRDILPVRDNSLCVETCRSSIDPRERHLVCKLDRYELEDKYLRLLEEASNLKKMSNRQEDKIKRLATKLMRVTANPRACMVAFDIYDDKKKVVCLELENSKLKDKIAVLRNQLLSHTITGRSSSRSRNTQARPSSGRISCRSENSRTKIPSCPCIVEGGDDDNDERNSAARIEKLEAQKSQLEKELSTYTATSQREKAAENVEYIKVWRQMKQLNDKLIVAQSTNESLNAQINDLKRTLEETTKNNKEVSIALQAEKKRVAEVDGEMLKAKDSQLSLREKDEQIKDLMSEMQILQQHNSELVALSSKYGGVELENKELKRRITEQLRDRETLKTAFCSEQASIAHVQASNEQLLEKLQDLQNNIDSLTVQMSSFQTQTDRQEALKAGQIAAAQPDKKVTVASDDGERYEGTGNEGTKCKKCCETYEKIVHLEETVYVSRGSGKFTDKSIQTECTVQVSMNTKDQGTSAMTPVKEKPKEEDLLVIRQDVELTRRENPLTPENMLKLLEQAQISTPLDAAKFSHKDIANNVDFNDILDLNQRHRQVVSLEKLLFGDSSCQPAETLSPRVVFQNVRAPLANIIVRLCYSDTGTATQAFQGTPAPQLTHQLQNNEMSTSPLQPLQNQITNLSNMLFFLFNVLREHPVDCPLPCEVASLYRPKTPNDQQFANDINNNIDVKDTRVTKKTANASTGPPPEIEAFNDNNKNSRSATNVAQSGCNARKGCTGVYNGLRQETLTRRVLPSYKNHSQVVRFSECEGCTCDDSLTCRVNSDCTDRCCSNGPASTQPAMTDCAGNELFDSSVQNCAQNVGTVYMTCKVQDEGGTRPYRRLENSTSPEKRKDVIDNSQSLHEYVKQLDTCREVLSCKSAIVDTTGSSSVAINEDMYAKEIIDPMRSRINKQPVPETRRVESFCSLDYPNECIDASSSVSDSFPLMIADGQGLMEVHILSLQLSTSAKQILSQEKHISNVSLFISWNIWNQETAFTPTLKCPTLNFNSSFVYRITNLSSFFNYVLLEYIVFKVHVYREENSYMVSTGKLSIKDILDYPQNKLHYIAPVNSVLSCSLGDNFGQLSLWVRLSCDIDKVEAYKRKRGLHLQTESPRECSIRSFAEVSEETASTPANDLIALKDDLHHRFTYDRSMNDLPAFKTPVLLSKSSNDNSAVLIRKSVSGQNASNLTVMKESTKEVHPSDYNLRILNNPRSPAAPVEEEEAPQKMSSVSISRFTYASELQGNPSMPSSSTAITLPRTTRYVEARKKLIVYYRTGNAEIPCFLQMTEEDTIVIEIVNMVLFPKSSLMENNEIQLLYIEYSFLGHCGADMETVSIRKPRPPNQKLTFNFRKKFRVDSQRHSVEDNVLRSMLHDSMDPNIKFIIVCEPVPEETDTKECLEVGYAYFNIREYALADTESILSLPIYNADETENVGLLKISVLGLETIRQRLARRGTSF
ncbi:uncharacterized protein LOC143367990 [Andrena cerasifolii]|uniref:uncharacterized protein LOC143367990 n=1 Tax=Andrena cerasifolii TaxID=2819439 RepID=UPI0040378214